MCNSAAITSVFGPSVRDFGPICIYTLFDCHMVLKKKVRENTKPNTITHITDLEKIFPDN